jgi:signal transduction histidine kinase
MNRYLRAKLIDRGEVRAFAPQDALAVVDLLYRARGYTHRGRAGRAFDPDALAARSTRGDLSATVAARADGRIAGYMALRRIGAAAVEVVEAVVEPDVHGGEIAQRLGEACIADARRLEARKVVWAAPALETAPQRTQAELGFRPCWLATGEQPPPGARVPGPRGRERESFVGCALALEAEPLRVWLPGRHAALVRRIYEALALPREEAPAGDPAEPQPARGLIDVELRPAWQSGRIRVIEVGEDALGAIGEVVDDLERGLIEHIEVRVPLDGPHGPPLVESLEGRGFFFCGIDPAAGAGAGRDEAVLARIVGARLDPRRLELEQDLARELLDHVVAHVPPSVLDTAEIAPPAAPQARPASGPRVPPPPLEMIEFARLAGQKQLISGLSHEINNPLNIILGSTYYLKQRVREGKTDEVLARLGAIEEEVARVAKVLDNVRRFAHPEDAPRGRLDVGGPMRDALALLEAELRAAGVDVRRALQHDLPAIAGNAAELEQVFFQLLRNALEASSAGGEIALEARREGDRVVAIVRDRGRGISLEDQRRVFDPFFTTKERGVGAGLGLPIARAIVDSHGGRLWLESRPGEGTTALVALPLAREPAPAHDHEHLERKAAKS